MKFVGLLRGINVGGHGKLPMKSLLEICADLGFENTKHYIQSGNIVFEARVAPDPTALSAAINSAQGFAPKVMFFEQSHFEQISRANPFVAGIESENQKYLHQFLFVEKPNTPNLESIATKANPGEKWHLRENCFDLYVPWGSKSSKLARDIEKILGVPMTARNWNTVTKLREMLAL